MTESMETYEEQRIKFEAARINAVDKFFNARPNLERTRDKEFLVEAGFRLAWEHFENVAHENTLIEYLNSLRQMPLIVINFDFSTEFDKSYAEGLEEEAQGKSFQTNCLDFFSLERNAVVMKKNGEWISSVSLLENNGKHTDKFIRQAHNVRKMLIAGAFDWRKDTF